MMISSTLGLLQATLAFHSADRGCLIKTVIVKAFAISKMDWKETGDNDATQ